MLILTDNDVGRQLGTDYIAVSPERHLPQSSRCHPREIAARNISGSAAPSPPWVRRIPVATEVEGRAALL